MRRFLDPESSSLHAPNANTRLPLPLMRAHLGPNYLNNLRRPNAHAETLADAASAGRQPTLYGLIFLHKVASDALDPVRRN